jgi:hypothetical protein
MSGTEAKDRPAPDPDSTPFETPPIEGLPYRRNSDEDLAIRRIIEAPQPFERAKSL